MERNVIVMIVARNIEAAIARQGTNPAEVARRAGINPTGVYDILKGKSNSPRLDTIHKIATKGLGLPMSALFTEPSDEELDRELTDTIARMPPDERRRFLNMAQAFLRPEGET